MDKVDWTSKLIEYIDGTKDFLLEKAPHFLQEIVTYGRVMGTIYCFLFLIFFFGTVMLMKKLNSLCEEEPDAGETYAVLGIICLIFIIISTLVFLFSYLPDLIKAWFAPKLFIYSFLKGAIV